MPVDYQLYLLTAIRIVGSQAKLARLIQVNRKTLNHWLNRNLKIPFEYAIAIEYVTDNQINRYQLAPHARFLKRLKRKPL